MLTLFFTVLGAAFGVGQGLYLVWKDAGTQRTPQSTPAQTRTEHQSAALAAQEELALVKQELAELYEQLDGLHGYAQEQYSPQKKPRRLFDEAVADTADPTFGDGVSDGNAPPQQAAGAAVLEGTDVDAAAGADIPSPEQCLGCDSLMDQLRDTSDEVHQLRVRLAEATEALQASKQHERELMMQLAAAAVSGAQGSPLRLSPPRVGLHCGRVRSALPASFAPITIA